MYSHLSTRHSGIALHVTSHPSCSQESESASAQCNVCLLMSLVPCSFTLESNLDPKTAIACAQCFRAAAKKHGDRDQGHHETTVAWHARAFHGAAGLHTLTAVLTTAVRRPWILTLLRLICGCTRTTPSTMPAPALPDETGMGTKETTVCTTLGLALAP